MDKRKGTTDKKTDSKTDRGDARKANEKTTKKFVDENVQVNIRETRDRGDSERKPTNHKAEKMKLNLVVKKSTNDESKLKNACDNVVLREQSKRIYDNGESEVELRKRIRDKYTLKLKSLNKSEHSNGNLNKNEGKTLDVNTDASKNGKTFLVLTYGSLFTN